MIPKPIEKLAREISLNEAKRKGYEIPSPEQWLVALLLSVKDEMDTDRGSAMLQSTVMKAFYENNLKKAGRLLEQNKHRNN